ncbi:uncharacterized protein [Primulina eburnea]|uniref:uncharacterized protein n=1 Tax=Primulina eburnea TaxID=1245227 RepID=UPI003C6CA58E
MDMYSSVITVLENMVNDGASNSNRGEVSGALIPMKSFDFIFILHLMHKIMGDNKSALSSIARKISIYLSAMDYVLAIKTLLGTLREERFDLLLSHVKELCVKYDIEIPQMEACYKSGAVEELNRFKDEAVELLKLSCALEPKENFKILNVYHIYQLAEKFYYLDFDSQYLHHLRMQLDHYKLDVAGHERFQNILTISKLCRRLIETNKSGTYELIDR